MKNENPTCDITNHQALNVSLDARKTFFNNNKLNMQNQCNGID